MWSCPVSALDETQPDGTCISVLGTASTFTPTVPTISSVKCDCGESGKWKVYPTTDPTCSNDLEAVLVDEVCFTDFVPPDWAADYRLFCGPPEK